MFRILSVQPVAELGGSDQALLRMVRSLDASEFEMHVVVPADPPLRPELEATGAVIHVVAMERISGAHGLVDWVRYALAWPLTVFRLVRLARALRIDVVHTNSLHSWYGWAAAAVLRRPHVWHAREIVVQSRAALVVERFLTRHFATTVVAGSRAIADQLSRADVEVIYELPSSDDFAPDRAGRFRSAIGIADGAPVAASVGRIDTWKGIDVLLDAWPDVRAAVPEAELVIAGPDVVGKEAYGRGLEARATGLPGVRWLGPRSDVAALLADTDALAAPSTEPEPYGLSLVEALASGCPVVSTDAGGPREIAEFATVGSVSLIAPRDAGALAGALTQVLGARTAVDASGRRERARLVPAPSDDFARVLRQAAEQGRG